MEINFLCHSPVIGKGERQRDGTVHLIGAMQWLIVTACHVGPAAFIVIDDECTGLLTSTAVISSGSIAIVIETVGANLI